MSFGKSFPNYGTTNPAESSRPRTMSDVTLYNQLSDNISCNIFAINNNVAALESAFKDIGMPQDSEALRDKIHNYRQSINELVRSTTRFLGDIQRTVERGAGKEQRFQAKRLENEFRETVKRYDILQKQLVPKMTQAVLAPKNRKNPWGVTEEDDSSVSQTEQQLQQQQLISDLEFEHGLQLEREQRIRVIESDILDVNETFRELGAMIHEQGDTIGTIEENITSTAYRVETGTQELVKASSYQKKYRKKLCWLILILIVISTVIAIIVVVETKS